MIDFWFVSQVVVALAATLLALILGLAKRLPSLVGLGALAVVELGLLVQLGISIWLSISGQVAAGGQFEFFTYLVVAALIPWLAGFWAVAERVFWSNFVIAVGAFTVFVMLARMHILWFG